MNMMKETHTTSIFFPRYANPVDLKITQPDGHCCGENLAVDGKLLEKLARELHTKFD
jgi:hypothetical protein